jgi:hypothetical protein
MSKFSAKNIQALFEAKINSLDYNGAVKVLKSSVFRLRYNSLDYWEYLESLSDFFDLVDCVNDKLKGTEHYIQAGRLLFIACEIGDNLANKEKYIDKYIEYNREYFEKNRKIEGEDKNIIDSMRHCFGSIGRNIEHIHGEYKEIINKFDKEFLLVAEYYHNDNREYGDVLKTKTDDDKWTKIMAVRGCVEVIRDCSLLKDLFSSISVKNPEVTKYFLEKFLDKDYYGSSIDNTNGSFKIIGYKANENLINLCKDFYQNLKENHGNTEIFDILANYVKTTANNPETKKAFFETLEELKIQDYKPKTVFTKLCVEIGMGNKTAQTLDKVFGF